MTSGVPVKEMNIILIGFMGVGKTTIGRLVAKKLMRDFIDVDAEIEKRFGMEISDIFKTVGEDTFRQMERELIREVCVGSRLKVIALGGGAYQQEEVRRMCLDTGIVIFLDLSWEKWKGRLPLIVHNRPVLQGKSLEEIEDLYYRRQAAYAEHNSKVNVDRMEAEEAAEHIVEAVKLCWELYT